MSQNFEGLYPRPEPVPFELTIGEDEQDFSLNRENSQIVRYWDDPEDLKIFRKSETNPGQPLRLTHRETAEMLLSEEFFDFQR